ncbi:MAG TPA: hypothetical protein VF784_15995 [Anaerolineales bacterium]
MGVYGILSGVMRYRGLLAIIALAVSSLACQAVMRLAHGLEPTALAAFPGTPAPAIPPAPSPIGQGLCPAESNAIIRAANSENLPPDRFPTVDTSNNPDILLVTYNIQGSQLSAPILAADVPDDLVQYQEDFAAQRSIWELFTSIIPAAQRQMLSRFQIITDGPGGVLSAVEQAPDDPGRWALETDIADAADKRNLAFTLLHEFGHLLTLNSAQVPPNLAVFTHPDSKRVLDRAVAACGTYFPGEGCSLPDSYVNAFFARFWQGLYDEWSAIDQIQDDNRREARLHAFYRKYEDRFVDSYAVTSPAEDIAETWAYYVLSPRPGGTSIKEQKMSFFYAYPELVTLRGQILRSICKANP